ncbi:hypothetical protein [Deinococcus sp. PESE-13]
MKSSLFRMTGAALLLGLPAAHAASVGGFVGSDAGVYYQSNQPGSSTRYGLTGLGLFSQQVTVAGEVASLRDFPNNAPNTFGSLTPYYGFGLGAGVSLGNSSSFSLYPHALLGLRYNTRAPLSVYGEVNAGARATIGGGTNIGLGGGARIGVNLNIAN